MHLFCALLALAAPAAVFAQFSTPPVTSQTPEPLTVGQKALFHVDKAYNPLSLLQSSAQAGVLQWNDDPREWHQGYYGFWRRTVSTIGYDTVRNMFMFTLNSTLRQDPRYYPAAPGSAASARLSHGFKQTFLGHTDSGKPVFAFIRFAATYGVAFLANSWNPDRLSDNRHAVVRGTVTLASDAGNNMFFEFWPDIKKRIFHRKHNSKAFGRTSAGGPPAPPASYNR